MSAVVHGYMPSQEEEAAQIKVTGSASRLASPLIVGTNHQLGHKMGGGLIHAQTMDRDRDGSSGTHKIMTFRHPNCDYLMGWFWVRSWTQSPASITCEAGSGTTTTVAVEARDGDAEVVALFPWGASDSGIDEIRYSATSCQIGGAMICMVPRAELGSGDTFINEHDETYRAAGFGPNEYIIDSGGSDDLRDLQAKIKTANEAIHTQAASWTEPDNPRTATGTAWTKVFPTAWSLDHKFRHGPAPRFRSADTVQIYRCYVNARGSGHTSSYEWRVTTSQGTQTQTGLTSGSYGWSWEAADIDATADDSFIIEARSDAVGGTVDITGVSIFINDIDLSSGGGMS